MERERETQKRPAGLSDSQYSAWKDVPNFDLKQSFLPI